MRQTLAVLTVALALRLLVVWTVAANSVPGWLYQRGTEMGYLAQSVVDGQGLSSPFGVPTGPTAFFAPGYPLLVAAVFKLFGVYSQHSAIVLMLINLAANLVTIWLIMRIARSLFGSRAALTGGLFWACSPALIWMPSIFWDTSISTALLIGLIALALLCRDRPSRSMWLWFGLYAGVTSLLNPALILVVFAALGWTAWNTWRVHRGSIVLALAVFAIVFAPWPIRNARVFHAFVPLRTALGFDLWMGNHPGSNGMLDGSLFPTFNHTELDLYKTQGEMAYTNGKSKLTRDYIRAHPGTFLSLTARRAVRYWAGTGNEGGSLAYPIQALLTTLLGFAGMWVLVSTRRRNLAVLFALPLLLFPIPYYITHAEFRFRLVLDPLLTVLAAIALVHFFTRRKSAASTGVEQESLG